MDLRQAGRFRKNAAVALVGAGGKTTALFQLARALEGPVVVTASTHLGIWQADFADRHLIVTRPEDIEDFAGQIEGVTLVSGSEEGQRLQGLSSENLFMLRSLADRLGFAVLVEADGARQRPLKAPAPHEPVIPTWVQTVIVVAGLSGLGKPLDDKTVHRPDRFATLSEVPPGGVITAEGLARVLVSPSGGLKGIPAGARKAALLNQAGDEALLTQGQRIARLIVPGFDSVIISSLADKRIWEVVEPVAGIILSGGSSSRFGQPKMLLPWRGKPLIRHVTDEALAAGLSELVVVTGSQDALLREALSGLPVRFVVNTEWQKGQSTSVRKGLQALPENIGAAIFLMSDQPFLSADLIRALIGRHRSTLAPVIAPRVLGQRANPVLFDRDVFGDLQTLEGDTGGRAILSRHPVAFVDWEDEAILMDIDTPEDYQRLKDLE